MNNKFIKNLLIIFLLITVFFSNTAIIYAVDGSIKTGEDTINSDLETNIIDLNKNTNTIQKIASINWEILDNNSYDFDKEKDWEKIGAKLLEGKASNSTLWQQFQSSDGVLSSDMIKSTGINPNTMSNYDIRTLQSIIYLTGSKQNGGAGREYLSSPVITKGYNVLAGKEGQSQKDTQAKESDMYSIEKNPQSMENISAHSSAFGQAVDISEIDYVRSVAVVKDGDGKIVQMKKIPKKTPVKVEWQTEWRPDNQNPFSQTPSRDLLSLALANLFSMNLNTAFNDLTSMLAQNGDVYCDFPENNPQIFSDNLAQMVIKNLGLVCYLNGVELPTNFEPGYDLDKSGTKLGQLLISNLSAGYLPQSGLVGDDYSELEANIGKEWISQKLGLPENTLTKSNSHELLERVGRRSLEEKLNIAPDSLVGLDTNQTNLLVGRGYIEKQLNLAPGAMSKNTISEIKQYIGTEKADYIFSESKIIDRLLNLPLGKTEEFTKGTLSPSQFATEVGSLKIDFFKKGFSEEKYWDAGIGVAKGTINLDVYGNDIEKKKKWILDNFTISDIQIEDDVAVVPPGTPKPKISANSYFDKYFSTKFATNNAFTYGFLAQYGTRKGEDLFKKFLNGDKNSLYEMGLRTLSRILSDNQDMYSYFESWLIQENDSAITTLADVKTISLENRPEVSVIYPTLINSNFELSDGDLERIFILDRAEEVYSRIGRLRFLDSFTKTKDTENLVFGQKHNTDLSYYTSPFYKERFELIAKNNVLIDLQRNPQTREEVNQIINSANEAVNYKELTEDDIKYKRRITFYRDITDKIQKYVVEIKKKNNSANLSEVTNTVNELIYGYVINDPQTYSKDQIEENYSYYDIIYGTYKDLIDVVQNKITIKEYVETIGLKTLASNSLNHPNDEILIDANAKIIQNYQKSDSTLAQVAGNEFLEAEAQMLNSEYNLSGEMAITSTDVANFLNGSYFIMCAKIGSQVANGAYQVSDFYNFLKGVMSGADLRSKSPYYNGGELDGSNTKTVFGLFEENANSFSLGMDVTGQSTGIDVAGFYRNPAFNPYQSINQTIANQQNATGLVGSQEQNLTTDYTKYLLTGNINGMLDRIQAVETTKIYHEMYPAQNVSSADFMQVDAMSLLLGMVNNVSFNTKDLKIPGYFAGKYYDAQKDVVFKPIELGITQAFKDNYSDLDPKVYTNLLKKLSDKSLSKDDAMKVFQDFLNQGGFLDKLPNEIKGLVGEFLSGSNINYQNVSNLLVGLISNQSDVDDKTKNILNSVFQITFSDGFDVGQLSNLLNSIDSNILGNNQELKNILNGLGSIVNSNGEVNFSNFSSLLNAVNPSILQNDPKLNSILNGLGSVMSGGEFNISQLPALLNAIDPELLKNDSQLGRIINSIGTITNFNGNFTNISQITSLLNAIDPKILADKPQLNGILNGLGVVMSGGEFNISQLPALLNAIDPKILDKNQQLTGILNSVGGLLSGGQFNLSQLPALLNAIDPKMLQGDQKLANILTSLGGIMQGGQFNLSQLPNLITAIDPKILEKYPQMTQLLGVLGSMVNGGNFNLSQIPALLTAIDPKIFQNDPKLGAILNQMGTILNGGEFTPQSIMGMLTAFNVFDKIPTQYTDMLGTIMGMALSGGNIDPIQVVSLGLSAAGISSIPIPGIGGIPVGVLLNGFNNPTQLVSYVFGQFLTNAILGAAATGFVGMIAAALIAGLISSLFGSSGSVEYWFTACGFYPGFDKKDNLVENKEGTIATYVEDASGVDAELLDRVQLKDVDEAKEKALESDSPQDWGEFIKLRTKYDTIPTDEIEEDDDQTKDRKYSSVALENENTAKVKSNQLSSVVNWAKNKNNKQVVCMDKDKDWGGGGVFKNQKAELTDDQKKQIAKYKIKVLLGNLMNMREETVYSRTNNFVPTNFANIDFESNLSRKTNNWIIGKNFLKIKSAYAEEVVAEEEDSDKKYTRYFNYNDSYLDLRPTQILTYGGDDAFKKDGTYNYEKNDIAHFYVLRDSLWGDDVGAPGSQDINIIEGVNEGMGVNQKMWGTIHYGY